MIKPSIYLACFSVVLISASQVHADVVRNGSAEVVTPQEGSTAFNPVEGIGRHYADVFNNGNTSVHILISCSVVHGYSQSPGTNSGIFYSRSKQNGFVTINAMQHWTYGPSTDQSSVTISPSGNYKAKSKTFLQVGLSNNPPYVSNETTFTVP